MEHTQDIHICKKGASFIFTNTFLYIYFCVVSPRNGPWWGRNTYQCVVNPLKPELNFSAQRCLARFFTGILFFGPCISLIYARKTKKYTNYSVYYLCIVAPTYFGITLSSYGSVPNAFGEMLNWGVVDRIMWMGVLCLVKRCMAIINTTRLSTIFYQLLLNLASLRRH
jgi:hypothetical protein